MGMLIKETNLANGLNIQIFNLTRRYYGDYHRVVLEVCCQMEVIPEQMPETVEFVEVRSLLGEKVVHRRTLERMGVPTAAVDSAIDELIAQFTEHSLAYLASSSYPRKLILTELRRVRRKPAMKLSAQD